MKWYDLKHTQDIIISWPIIVTKWSFFKSRINKVISGCLQKTAVQMLTFSLQLLQPSVLQYNDCDISACLQAPHSAPSHIRADAVVHHPPRAPRADEIKLVVQAGQVHGQFQVLLVNSSVADPAAAIAQALWVLQVKGQRATSAGWAEGVRALAPAWWRRWGEAGRPVGLGEEGGRVGLWFITIVIRCWRRRGSWQSQGAGRRHGGKLWFLLFPLFRLLPLAAVILEFGDSEEKVNIRVWLLVIYRNFITLG